MENSVSNMVKSTKRRNKRSFMQRVQRLSKSKSFHNKTKFDSFEYDYFVRVLKMTRDFVGSNEEKVVFANNALSQTDKREVECSSNQLICRVIENLLPLASNSVKEKFFDAFGKDLRPICNHEFASHVLQALMLDATRHSLQNYDTKDDIDHKDVCHKWVIKVSKYLINNIDEYVSEMYANRVMRTAMYCLAGIPHLDSHNKSDNDQNSILKDVTVSQPTIEAPDEFKQLLEEFFTRISNWPHFKDMVCTSLQSGFLQCLLTTLHHVSSKKYKKLCHKIFSECFPFDSSGVMESRMFSTTALPVLEVIIENSKGKKLKDIYKNHLAGRLGEMCSVKPSSFTVKKLFEKCDTTDLMEEIVSEVLPVLPKILSKQHNNLLVSVCEACERLKCGQSEFFQGLVKALNCENNMDQLVTAVLAIKPLPHDTPPPPGCVLGSRLVQSLLRFQKPIKVVNSLLSYSGEQLATLLSTAYGSHITSAFCKSEFVGEKSRQKLILQLMGHYPGIATSKHGSRSFDDIWDVADEKHRLQMVKDLSSSIAKVMSSHFGKFVASKVHLDEFHKSGIDRWKVKEQNIQTKRKMFEPIIEGKKKRKSK